MTTREIIIQAVFEGQRVEHRISNKFGYILRKPVPRALFQYVDSILTDRDSLSDRLGTIDKEAYVSFRGNGEPDYIQIDGSESGEVLEVELKLDEFGEVFHWKAAKL